MEKYCPQQGLPERGDIVFVAGALSQVKSSIWEGVSQLMEIKLIFLRHGTMHKFTNKRQI